ncbi:XRE family transcriptional regulator [Sphingomonas aurantiaca]|uniref:helix-turn-helix domain-containing protein n=1 Tax=Sphingomonas aurantiaca TaxID=185949 RepID=UPI002FE23214
MDVQMFDSVFDALADTPAEAANMKARSELLSVLKARIRSWEVSQEAAAGRLGITRPRLNDLLQGKIAKFSLDALVNLATASGLTVHVHVAERLDPAAVTPARGRTRRMATGMSRRCEGRGGSSRRGTPCRYAASCAPRHA